MKRFCFLYLALSILGFTIVGCNKWLEEKNPPIMSFEFYDTEDGLNSAIIAGYSYLRWGVGGERFDVLTELGTDLFTEGEDGNYRQSFNRYSSQLNPGVDVLYDFWQNHYKGIGNVNVILQKIAESNLDTSVTNRLAAEAKFLRAYFYFDLVQQFGNIPLVLDGNLEIKTDFKRAPVAAVYNSIISDLRDAVQHLPVSVDGNNKGRATKWAAFHLLSKVYLTRGSAITDQRGQKPTDIDSSLYYSESVINSGYYSLQKDFADLWKMDNQGNSEVIFALQFTEDQVFNGDGNWQHLFFLSWYEDQPGMLRDIENGRPYRRHVPTDKTMDLLFDRKNDSRFFKSFKWVFYSNNQKTLPIWTSLSFDGQTYFTPDPAKGQIEGKLKFNLGDTAIFYSVERLNLDPNSSEMRKLRAGYSYAYFPRDMQSIRYFPPLIKHLNPDRLSVMETNGGREWVRMRLGETYLLAAEAAGRLGDFEKSANYINVLRERAAWHEGEKKDDQIWKFLGGVKGDTHDSFEFLKVDPSDLQDDFVTFILDERGRELLGELNRWEDLVRCEKLYDWDREFNPYPENIRPYHKLRPIPQNHIDRLSPPGNVSEEQNDGYF